MKMELAPRPAAVMGVESEIREALTNLIFNAVDAMPRGGTITVRTRLVSEPAREDPSAPATHVCLEVSDTGIGMDEETRRRCLEPFFTTKGDQGTGLGLAMVYGVMRRHEATIEIDSAPGRGTTVRLLFPLPATAVEIVPAAVAEPVAAAPLRVLVVDDDLVLLKSLAEVLEDDGHEVVTADGGQAAIGAFLAALEAGNPFAAVITDLGMPNVDGRRVASAVKAASPKTPVFLLTGWGQGLAAPEEIPYNVDRMLTKPPKLRDLREALASV
jgi:CheY-like chemotaxis protein/anti-sigma regulatory factor (Ser/Thr protein kinase)